MLRASSRRPDAAAPSQPRMLRRVLRLPLAVKLAGANALGAVIVAWGAIALRDAIVVGESIVVPAVALILAVAGTAALVFFALAPVRELLETATRVRRGDLDARVPVSPLAEERVSDAADTINRLLDGLAADRARMQQLAAQVVGAADRERAQLARELHDSTAQSFAALSMQLAAMELDTSDAVVRQRLASMRDIAQAAMEELRMLAHTLHPRVLDDLGLIAALRNLARRTQESVGVRVEVTVFGEADVPAHVASVLYRIAQESVYNALRHASASVIRVELSRGASAVRAEIVDDGVGFDVAEAELRRPGMGLFTMRERLSLVGGTMRIVSGADAGTRVIATVPLEPENENAQ